MQTDSCGASLNRRRGMRNGKHQRLQNVALSECHGKVVMYSVMESNTCATSWKGVMESDTCGASRNNRHGMRNGKHQRPQNVALSEYHGKVVMDGFMESNTCATSRKGVTEINICLVSRKRCHGKRDGNSEVRGVMEMRHGKRYRWSVTGKPSRNASRKA